MTDRWANIAFFYLTVILVMNSLILIATPILPEENQMFDVVDQNIAEGIPNTNIKIAKWYDDHIVTNFIIGGASIVAGEGGREALRLGFEFATTVLSVGGQMLSFLMSALFIYNAVFIKIGASFGPDLAPFAVMLSSMIFIAQILAIIIIASRVREVLRL